MRLKAYAKVNLQLDVTGRREDGYHYVESVMQSVSLYDIVEVELAESGIAISCLSPDVPCDERNTMHKAARVFFEHTGINSGVRITLGKSIPSQAGLGGGSADAAAVLIALDRLCATSLDVQTLYQLAIKVGSDVPFCITGGTCIIEGMGERVTPCAPCPQCTILLAKPGCGVSTAAAYGEIDRAEAAGKLIHTPAAPLVEACERKDLGAVAAAMGNVFEQAVNLNEISALREQMLSAGALNSMMTGSGSTVIGIFASDECARACADGINNARVCITNPVDCGIEII